MSVAPQEPTAEAIWGRVIDRARREFADGPFSMWFSQVRPAAFDGRTLELRSSDYARDWLARNYMDFLHGAASDAAGRPIQVQLVAERPTARREPPVGPDASRTEPLPF